MVEADPISAGVARAQGSYSEALHRREAGRCDDNLRMLWTVGYGDLIRRDYYELLDLSSSSAGHLLDAGCGTGIDAANFRRMAPGVVVHGVDVSAARFAQTVGHSSNAGVSFYQSSIDCMPFASESFDYLSMHEVIEHVEEPAVTLRELFRVLKPGAVGVIATPNGASLFPEHLRQRLVRLFGGRGAPVGEDHVRPPSFWRREMRAAGFEIEREMFDGSAIELQAYILPASWMHWTSRLLEPLRRISFVKLLICDRVKFRIRKPGQRQSVVRELTVCCPICRSHLNKTDDSVACLNGHRFNISPVGIVDFTSTVTSAKPDNEVEPKRSRLLRRMFLAASTIGYILFVAALLPVGFAVSRFHQPFAP